MEMIDHIERIETLVTSAKKLPGLGVMVDEKQLRDAVQKLRQAVPTDTRRAQQIIAEREELINQGAREAKRITAAAEEEFRAKIKDSAVVKASDRRAQEILAEAEDRARAALNDAEREAAARRNEANQYTLEVLRTLDAQLTGLIGSVRKGIALLERDTGTSNRF